MKNTESQPTQKSVEETDNKNSGKEIIRREKVEGTEFVAVKIEEGWFLTLGSYRLTNNYETKEELLSETVEKKDEKGNAVINWEFMLNIVSVYYTAIGRYQKDNN